MLPMRMLVEGGWVSSLLKLAEIKAGKDRSMSLLTFLAQTIKAQR
jgi:hypothetical protein